MFFRCTAGKTPLFTGIKIPSFINDLITPIGDATIPVSMLVLGIQLAESDLKKAMLNRKLLLVTFISLIISQVVTFLAVNWFPLVTGAIERSFIMIRNFQTYHKRF